MAETPFGETNQEPLQPAGTPSAPTVDNTPAAADVEAQKNAEKLQMEINMLRKQKDALEKEKLEREKKELEEKEDYRSLAERAQAEAEALRKEKEDAETKSATQSATEAVYKDFPENVQKIAKTAGLTVQADSEEARAALKTKLESIQSDVGVVTPKIQGSNPAPTTPNGENSTEFIPVRGPTADVRGGIIFRNNLTANERMKNLESIKVMKQIAGVEAQEFLPQS